MKNECRARESAERTAPKYSSPSIRNAARVAVSILQQLRPGARIGLPRAVSRSEGAGATASAAVGMATAMLAWVLAWCLRDASAAQCRTNAVVPVVGWLLLP